MGKKTPEYQCSSSPSQSQKVVEAMREVVEATKAYSADIRYKDLGLTKNRTALNDSIRAALAKLEAARRGDG